MMMMFQLIMGNVFIVANSNPINRPKSDPIPIPKPINNEKSYYTFPRLEKKKYNSS